MFSIIIPTLNNFNYLKICINSIKKNSKFKHQIVVHVNEGRDQTLKYLKLNKIDFTFTKKNVGLCEGVNMAAKKANHKFIVYSHDDFYFCPNWDNILLKQIKSLKHKKFYLSGTMFDTLNNKKFFCGDAHYNFDENKLLKNYKKIKINDFQGSTWAPHIVHTEIWKAVGGFSEEFFPGAGSDPDFVMKLWKINVRIFKGMGKSLVYHFGSKTLRNKKNKYLFKNLGSESGKIFIKKWGFSIKFFKKFYLRANEKYNGPLSEPEKTLKYYFNLLICKLYYIYLLFKNTNKNKIY